MRVVHEIGVALLAPQLTARYVMETITAFNGAGTNGLYNPTSQSR